MERDRKISNTQPVNIEPAVAVRSTKADARGSIQLGYDTDSGSEKQDRETEKTQSGLRRQTSLNNVSQRNPQQQMFQQQQQQQQLQQQQQPQHSKEKDTIDGDGTRHMQSSPPIVYDDDVGKRKITSFAALPNQTTWQQQSAIVQQLDNNGELFF